ncbi:MAG: ribosome recycling factor [Myxococcota bacterium]|jgi:ribosome recycling factor
MSNEYISAMKDDFTERIGGLEKNLSTIRTGRATPQLLDSVQIAVASYGATMPLKQLATIQAPDARLLVVNPWDKGTLKDIERGLLASDLGLTPSSDGQIIRLPVPPLTGERRQQLIRQVRKLTEDGRIAARQVRKDYNDLFKSMEQDKDISEDDLRGFLADVQQATDDAVKQMEAVSTAKEQEVMEV